MKNTKKNRKNNLRRKQIKSNKKGGLFGFGSSKPKSSEPLLRETVRKVGVNDVCQAEIQNKKITFE